MSTEISIFLAARDVPGRADLYRFLQHGATTPVGYCSTLYTVIYGKTQGIRVRSENQTLGRLDSTFSIDIYAGLGVCFQIFRGGLTLFSSISCWVSVKGKLSFFFASKKTEFIQRTSVRQ